MFHMKAVGEVAQVLFWSNAMKSVGLTATMCLALFFLTRILFETDSRRLIESVLFTGKNCEWRCALVLLYSYGQRRLNKLLL